MGMLLCCGDGLLYWEDAWRRMDCPLTAPSLADHSDGRIAAVDNESRQLWHGDALLPCDRDVEALRLWRGHALVLSSDTDCLSIADGDGWLVTARVGMYPQDMCIVGDMACVCGGADGLVHLLTLPELHDAGSCCVPGIPQRIDAHGQTAHILCTVGDEELHTLVCRVNLITGDCQHIAHLPGIPGAVYTDGAGGIWAAATELLYHFPCGVSQPDAVYEGFGLIRHMAEQDGTLLAADPLEGLVVRIAPKKNPAVQVLYSGDVGWAGFM